jgi:hypothetical protein
VESDINNIDQLLAGLKTGMLQQASISDQFDVSSRSPKAYFSKRGFAVASVDTCVTSSDVLAWLGLEASGFGLALSGFSFQDPQAKP